MISLRILPWWLLLGIVPPCPAAPAAPGPPPAAPPVVVQTTAPKFPHELEFSGIRQGEADVAVEVGPSGQLQDILIVAYTRKAFAADAVRAIKTWEFHPPPAEVPGENWCHVFRIKYHLEGFNVIMYQPAEHLTLAGLALLPEDWGTLGYAVCAARDLDRIPQPKSLAAPAGDHLGTVEVDFYIDEQGRVRIPTLAGESDPRLAAAALAAVRTWQFEPPTRAGKPVLVQVEQVFHFKAPPAAASTQP